MTDPTVYSLIPVGLLAIYYAIFQTEKLFLSLAFLTPLSINIEEYTSSFGLFVPTEPLLFGLMILLSAFQIKKAFLPQYIWRSPLIWAIVIYILWMLLSALTSSHPIVSFKFILARLWFIVPVLFFGTYFFQKRSNRISFIWLFLLFTRWSIILFMVLAKKKDTGWCRPSLKTTPFMEQL